MRVDFDVQYGKTRLSKGKLSGRDARWFIQTGMQGYAKERGWNVLAGYYWHSAKSA